MWVLFLCFCAGPIAISNPITLGLMWLGPWLWCHVSVSFIQIIWFLFCYFCCHLWACDTVAPGPSWSCDSKTGSIVCGWVCWQVFILPTYHYLLLLITGKKKKEKLVFFFCGYNVRFYVTNVSVQCTVASLCGSRTRTRVQPTSWNQVLTLHWSTYHGLRNLSTLSPLCLLGFPTVQIFCCLTRNSFSDN